MYQEVYQLLRQSHNYYNQQALAQEAKALNFWQVEHFQDSDILKTI
jgi:hypothetical protein